jgi:hypothetical protein
MELHNYVPIARRLGVHAVLYGDRPFAKIGRTWSGLYKKQGATFFAERGSFPTIFYSEKLMPKQTFRHHHGT